MPTVLITRETAAEYGRRGRESQARERRAVQEQAALLSQALAIVRRADVEQLTDYRAIRLARVRQQLDRIDEMIARESDPQRLSALASASDKLAEQERLLAGRPAPKAEESRRNHVRQGVKNSAVAELDRASDQPG